VAVAVFMGAAMVTVTVRGLMAGGAA
jgi:hypothetical protein